MDFTEQARAIVGRIIAALSVSSESPEAMRHAACEDVAAALQAVFEAGRASSRKDLGEHFGDIVPLDQAIIMCGIVDCTGAKAVVRRVKGKLPIMADGVVLGFRSKPDVPCERCGQDEPAELVWHPEWLDRPASLHYDFHFVGCTDAPVGEFYSTREAAEAGRKA